MPFLGRTHFDCARVLGAISPAEAHRLLTARRVRRGPLAGACYTNLLKGEHSFEFEDTPVFWHGEWRMVSGYDVEIEYERTWNAELHDRWWRNVRELVDCRSYFSVEWQSEGKCWRLTYFHATHSNQLKRDEWDESLMFRHLEPVTAFDDFDVVAELWGRHAQYRVATRQIPSRSFKDQRLMPQGMIVEQRVSESQHPVVWEPVEWRPVHSLRNTSTSWLSFEDREDLAKEAATIRLNDIGNTESATRLYDETLERLKLMFGLPHKLTIGFRAEYHAMAETVAACRRMSPTCDHWELLGRYRKGFSPFDCPNLPAADIVTYPLCNYLRAGKSVVNPDVHLQLSIVWRGQEGFLELQSTQGPECLQQIADAAGLEIEIWEGPLAERWGLYTD